MNEQGDHLVGQEAKLISCINAKNTVYDVKRLIGRKLTHPIVSKALRHWQFTVSNDNNRPTILVWSKGKVQRLSLR